MNEQKEAPVILIIFLMLNNFGPRNLAGLSHAIDKYHKEWMQSSEFTFFLFTEYR